MTAKPDAKMPRAQAVWEKMTDGCPCGHSSCYDEVDLAMNLANQLETELADLQAKLTAAEQMSASAYYRACWQTVVIILPAAFDWKISVGVFILLWAFNIWSAK